MNKNFWKLITLYKQLGFKKAFEKLLHFTISKICLKKDDLVLLKNLNGEIKFSQENKFQIQSIAQHHFFVIKQFNEKYRDKSNIRASVHYLKNNYQGFIAFLNNEMIGCWWWVANKIHPTITHPCILRFGISLEDDEVYGFDFFLAPQYRGQGNAIKFLSMIYYELKKMGYNRIWGYVAVNNIPARWLYDINGYRIVNRIVSYEVFSLLLFQDKKVFIKNTSWNSKHSFDHRLLFSLKSRKD